MGTKLDWQIESDKRYKPSNQHSEDPKVRRQRAVRSRRVIVTVLAMLVIIAGVVWFIQQRLEMVDSRQRSLLENTVKAEITALNVGERATFDGIQRSATLDWLNLQGEAFTQYQADKVTTDRVLTGRIYEVVMDGQRGRVQVEEIENGTPYTLTWFYWNYDTVLGADGKVLEDGGWHHVAPDYTFWGQPRTLEQAQYSIRYQSLDDPFAQALDGKLAAWFGTTCATLECGRLPYLTVDINANPMLAPMWVNETDWQLVIPSPYSGRARHDQPFDMGAQQQVADALAERLVTTYAVQPDPNEDAAFFVEAARSWFLGQWLQVDTQSHLMTSIAAQYGQGKIGQLLSGLRSNSDLTFLGTVLGVDLATANLDWRDFLNWRLALEAEAVQNGDQVTYLRLYDPALQQTAIDRYNAYVPATTVGMVTAQTSPNGTAQLVATTEDGQQIIFNWGAQGWVRGS
jgi:hypothetical protein